jgi:hygromycin-B 4-O-kinase
MSIIDAVSVTDFLRFYFDLRIWNVERLGAGMFSQAFSFNLEKEEFVIRLNPYVEDFQKDAFAYQQFSSKLPIPTLILLLYKSSLSESDGIASTKIFHRRC